MNGIFYDKTFEKQPLLPRSAGILLPVFSLPSAYGIGTLGKPALDFIDFCVSSGLRYWQVLPLGPTGYKDSPYQSFSCYAGNPYFVDLDILRDEGLLSDDEINNEKAGGRIDYGRLYNTRRSVLELAFSRSDYENDPSFTEFCRRNSFWLDDYCLFTAAKDYYGGVSWLDFPDRGLAFHDTESVRLFRDRLRYGIDFCAFIQYKFFCQWQRLSSYAQNRGINIIGDLPIYAAPDSADVWAHPEEFQLDSNRRQTALSGVPPDIFSSEGQLWGNPLYDYSHMAENGFAFWKKRVAFQASIYDVIRIDHFIGLVNYYSVPAGAGNARLGEWKSLPSYDLLCALCNAKGDVPIIAEDLGVTNKTVKETLDYFGFPGMRLIEFAFDNGYSNENLPCNYPENCVVYGGTHDNETLLSFFRHQPGFVTGFAKEYLSVADTNEIPFSAIRAAFSSPARLCVFTAADYMGLDNSARINTPATTAGNWAFRATADMFSPSLSCRIRSLCEDSKR